MTSSRVLIIGGGFAGLNAAKELSQKVNIQVTLIDKKNYHLFQPLLYQVATAGLSPAEIAAPIRSVLAKAKNIDVVMAQVDRLDLQQRKAFVGSEAYDYDYLILACGATHSYFGKDQWESFAPGLKNLEDATQIRRKILLAFEKAEIEKDPEELRSLLTFVLVGGGPTGVELAGSIAELSRQTLKGDFKHIDPRNAQVLLIEAGPRLLSGFETRLSETARKNLEDMGVQVRTNTTVTEINSKGVQIENQFIHSHTIIWAAGVQATQIPMQPENELDRAGRLLVHSDLSLPKFSNVFVCGDMSHFELSNKKLLPGLAAVAMQQGRHAARMIENDLSGRPRSSFQYRDKGLMATIGRNKAVLQMNSWRASGIFAWLAWLFVHIYYLIGFQNRLLVLSQWAWAYLTFKRGARLIGEVDGKIRGPTSLGRA